jgi:AhpD family alkylhydroperoxidase
VAALIPCQYCIIARIRLAKADGSTDAVIKQAMAAAALTPK